jgi:hypothetical protein
MNGRCYCTTDRYFMNYGGRGIRVCDRWHSFDDFLADVGERPHGMTLERINNDGDYGPDNWKWATRAEQNRNKRNNRVVEIDGRRMILAEWARITGISSNTIVSRLNRGVSPSEAIRP